LADGALVSGRAGTQTFVFADLAGYTALTEAHGDEEAADAAA
jgi:class 3 adenylate cyclase